MRIPVKEQTQLNGYRPALDLSSKDKLIWFKNKTNGIPTDILFALMPITVAIGSSWSRKVGADDPNFEVNVYQTLGHNKFILAFIIAALIGVLGYIWGLFVYDRLKVKKVPIDKSIELYIKTPKYTEEKQERMKKWWWGIPAAIIMLGVAFSLLFFSDSRNFAGGGFAIILYIFALLVYLALYKLTVFLSRIYLNKKFNIKTKNKTGR